MGLFRRRKPSDEGKEAWDIATEEARLREAEKWAERQRRLAEEMLAKAESFRRELDAGHG